MTRVLSTGLWWLVVLLSIVSIVFLQFDLLSQDSPRFARLVPSVFQSRAATALASKAIEQGDWPSAGEAAATVVVRRPIPASSLVVLSLARSHAGKVNDPVALAALSAAAGRGWRDGLAQAGAVAMALDAQRFDIAAIRVDALWRIDAIGTATEPVIRSAFAQPEVRAQLAGRFAAGVPWATDMLTWATANVAPDDLVDFMEHAIADGAVPDCALLGTAAKSGIQSGRPALARRVWRRFCHSSGSEIRFVEPRAKNLVFGPFDWTFPPGAGVATTITPEGAIHYRVTSRVRVPLAERWSDLTPGTYTMTLQYTGRDPVLRLGCVSERQQDRTDAIPWVRGVTQFTVSTNCATQQIMIEVDAGEGVISAPILQLAG